MYCLLYDALFTFLNGTWAQLGIWILPIPYLEQDPFKENGCILFSKNPAIKTGRKGNWKLWAILQNCKVTGYSVWGEYLAGGGPRTFFPY